MAALRRPTGIVGENWPERTWNALLELLHPLQCRLCLELGQPPVCPACRNLIRPLPSGSCPRCALGDAGDCAACRWMSSLDWVRGAADYKGAAGLAVRSLKFNRHVGLAGPMAGLMLPIVSLAPEVDFVAPVPIHWSRRAYRGFNQAELLAEHTGAANLRRELLRRTRPTLPQMRLTGAARRANLEGAIASKPCPQARVLLIDDVVTSGGTLEACASALKSAGASWVGAVTYSWQLPEAVRAQASGSSRP